MTEGSGGLDNEFDRVEVVDEVDEVDNFRRTVGDGGLNVLEVSSEATLLLVRDRLLP